VGQSIEAYIAIGFPLIVGAAMAVFFPIRLKNYFSDEEIGTINQRLLPYKLDLKDAVYIFIVYIASASVLGLIQAYLFWHFAADTEVRFSSRFTDYFLYPFIPSALMGVLLMWFVFCCRAYSKGEQRVREFLLRSYDGWGIFKEIPKFRFLVIAAALICVAANLWTYNIYLYVTDEVIVTSNHKRLGPYVFGYDRIEFFRIEWHRGVFEGEEGEAFVLGLKLRDGGVYRTDLNLLYKENMLQEIDQIIKTAEEASGQNYDVVFT
jgi:hypothetical protein